MDEQQKKLLTHMALLAAFGGGSGAMAGSGSGALMGGLSLPLIYMLMQRSGALGGSGVPNLPNMPDTPKMSPGLAPSAIPAPQWFAQNKHDYSRKTNALFRELMPKKQFGVHKDPTVQALLMRQRSDAYHRKLQDRLGPVLPDHDANNTWKFKPPTTQVGQNAQAVESVANAAGRLPLVGLPLMAFPGRVGGLGRTLWGRTFIPAAIAEDAAKTVKNVAEHGMEGATLANADSTRRALMRAPLIRYGTAVDDGAPLGEFISQIGMAPFRLASNVQTIAGGLNMTMDETGRDWITPPWRDQNTYRPERQMARQLEAKRKQMVQGLRERGAPLDATGNTDLLGWTSQQGQTANSAARADSKRYPITNPPPAMAEKIFGPKVQDNRSLKDRAAHPNPDGASFKHYWFGGR